MPVNADVVDDVELVEDDVDVTVVVLVQVDIDAVVDGVVLVDIDFDVFMVKLSLYLK